VAGAASFTAGASGSGGGRVGAARAASRGAAARGAASGVGLLPGQKVEFDQESYDAQRKLKVLCVCVCVCVCVFWPPHTHCGIHVTHALPHLLR
jgi:hypothetical protein